MKWKQHITSITIPVSDVDRMRRQAKRDARDIKREMREVLEIAGKRIVSDVYGVTLYHHGDPV